MRIYVTQGHERGIGLEVFFKSCLFLSQKDLSLIKLLAFKESVAETLKGLNYPYELSDKAIHISGIKIDVEWPQDIEYSQSYTALKRGMILSEEGGVLLTLPTSKDQFPHHPGHTEFFRSFYQRPELGMFFSSPKLQVLLLTDHLAINALSTVMTEELIYTRLKNGIKSLQSWLWPIRNILISGLNPHAGENGLIGTEDKRISAAIERLKAELKIDMSGPWPGDTMLFEQTSAQDLMVYMYHDQGLGVFKGLMGLVGSNITLGLPFPRVSPDHGTSFALFGKNQADYRGCAFALKEGLSLLQRISYGKNSSH